MSTDPNANFLQKHQHLTISELKRLNYQGQGQVQPGDELWKGHMANCAREVVDELERGRREKK